MIALVPDTDLGIVMLWNGESTLPTGLLPTMLDRALNIPSSLTAWLDPKIDPNIRYAARPQENSDAPGSTATRSTAAPQ